MARFDSKKGDDTLLVGLASGKSICDAAADAGLSIRTAHRRLEDDDFRRRLTEARADMIGQAVGALAASAVAAVETLNDLLRAESESVRLGAARSILEIGNRLRESTEFEQRLAELEQAINAKH